MAFQIPNQQGYLPRMQPPQQDVQGVQSSPIDPLMSMFIQMLTQQTPAPPPPPKLGRGTRAAMYFMTPENQQRTMENYQQADPAYRQYAAQVAGQEQRTKMMGPLASLVGSQNRTNFYAGREARLDEQFRWRQLLQSQYKRERIQVYNPETGLNEWWDRFFDPMNNNMEMGRVPAAFTQMHYGAVAGPGGEMYQYPTSNMPPAGATPGGQPGRIPGMPTLGAPPPQPTGTPTTGANVPGSIPTGGSSGSPPAPGNARRLGIPKQPAASVAQNYAAQSAFLSGVEELLEIQRQAHDAQVKASGETGTSLGGLWSGAKQVGKELMARSEFTQPTLATMAGGQDIIGYRVRMMPKLFNYVKAQTGVQFGYREFLQYSSLFPTSLDNPETARQKIESLIQVIRANKTELERQFHALGQGQTPMIGGRRLEMSVEQFETMQEEDPQAAQEFLQDGGVVR